MLLYFYVLVSCVEKTPSASNHQLSKDASESFASWREQYSRAYHIRSKCHDITVLQNGTNRKPKANQVYFVSPEYNFTFCNVPKAGSTFWAQAFYLFQKGYNMSRQIFGLSGLAIHSGKLKTLSLAIVKKLHLPSVLVSRDPYARLFSAYVDTMFVPSPMYHIGVEILNRQRYSAGNKVKCANDITFEEFLTAIAQDVIAGRAINRHWAPIYTMCDPCNIDIIAVMKMEYFVNDVKSALKMIGISTELLRVIDDGLQFQRQELTLPGLVESYITTSSKYVRGCLNKTEITRRIWVALQTRGVIHSGAEFPRDILKHEEKARNHTLVTELIFKSIRETPLSSEESRLQRHKALVNAYASINATVINDIKQLYRQDFILFDYSMTPPCELD